VVEIMDILLGQLIRDLKDEYEILSVSYGYGIAMAITKCLMKMLDISIITTIKMMEL
jgi:hypothetical protein